MLARKLNLSLAAAMILLASCAPKFKPVTFVQMTDTQVGFSDNSPGFRLSDSLFKAAVTSVNALKPDFVVVTGDLVDNVDDPLQERIFQERMSELEAPYYLIPGNHDFKKTWTKEIHDSYVVLRGPERFSFMKNGCAFIGIDTNCIKEDAPEAETEQFQWLKAELKKARKAKYRFIFVHCPVFKEYIDEKEDYENFSLQKRREYIDLFKQAGVNAVFAGHMHQDMDTTFEGIRMIVANPVCKPLGHGESGYNVVRVGKDGFEIEFVKTVLE